jgi:hypothetical protein
MTGFGLMPAQLTPRACAGRRRQPIVSAQHGRVSGQHSTNSISLTWHDGLARDPTGSMPPSYKSRRPFPPSPNVAHPLLPLAPPPAPLLPRMSPPPPLSHLSGTVLGAPKLPGENPPHFVKHAKRKLIHEAKTHTRHDHDPGDPRGPPERQS